MRNIKDIKIIRTVLVMAAIVIAILSLFISHTLVKDLSREERNKMEIFAEAYRAFNDADKDTDLSLALTVITGNNTIPVVVLDVNGQITDYLNIDIHKEDTLSYLARRVSQMRDKGNSIKLYYDQQKQDRFEEVCFDESVLLSRLTFFPFIQMGVVLIFVLIAIFALLGFKKTEQNRVWIGLSKETAHQLGTPISSLMAWTELLKDKYNDSLISEMEKDVTRLQTIADRFSKIGSMPETVSEDLSIVLEHVVTYIERRSPDSVKFKKHFSNKSIYANLNVSLFEWVVENLCKNAIDAMDGQGLLTISLHSDHAMAYIEISDTGKGITKHRFKTVFQPGFTTKKRGWGLGLSLAKRIVEEYHKGKIYVKRSEMGKGTTFRIELRK
ncbi:MAG TPA: HAMP domain-containing sensor histidine kinase [Bacteroidaceae bacterium]|nr:HAMP domain-containing sensor histidine kinase [Bacteroidaceae bacterium]